MIPRLTTEEFIRRAKDVHGDKYDYSKVEYKNAHTKVCIICPIHGDFCITPSNHLQGKGCERCARTINLPLVCGVGIYDGAKGESKSICKQVWHGMIQRCYTHTDRFRAYHNCSVCDEWLTFSNFKRWFNENYIEGQELDKDLLVKRSRIYSPDTCVFIPRFINTLLIKNVFRRGKLPIGVTLNSRKNGYRSIFTKNHKRVHLGNFTTPEEAFQAYKTAKEAYIKEVAQEYYDRGEITKKVYDALMRYEVEITD